MTDVTNQPTNPEKPVYIPTCPSQPQLRCITKEEREMGMRARTEKKRIANQLKAFRVKKCKNCTMCCPMRTANLEKDMEHRCRMPEAQQLILRMGADPEIIAQKLKQLLVDMDDLGSKSKFIKDKKMVYDAHIDFKKEFCPTTQTIKHEGKLDMGLNEILKIAQESKKDGTITKPSNSTTDTK